MCGIVPTVGIVHTDDGNPDCDVGATWTSCVISCSAGTSIGRPGRIRGHDRVRV